MSEAVELEEGYTAQLQALIDGLEPWVHLYTNDPPLTRDLSRGSLIEVEYEGYSAQSLAKWSPATLAGGLAFSRADLLFFKYTVGITPRPVRGYFCTNGKDGPLLWIFRRPGDPVQLDADNPQLIVALVRRFPLICPEPSPP